MRISKTYYPNEYADDVGLIRMLEEYLEEGVIDPREEDEAVMQLVQEWGSYVRKASEIADVLVGTRHYDAAKKKVGKSKSVKKSDITVWTVIPVNADEGGAFCCFRTEEEAERACELINREEDEEYAVFPESVPFDDWSDDDYTDFDDFMKSSATYKQVAKKKGYKIMGIFEDGEKDTIGMVRTEEGAEYIQQIGGDRVVIEPMNADFMPYDYDDIDTVISDLHRYGIIKSAKKNVRNSKEDSFTESVSKMRMSNYRKYGRN